METKRKFKLKRRYKRLIWSAYLSILAFVLYIAFIGTIIRTYPNMGDGINIALMCGIGIILLAGLMFTFYASLTRHELQMYMNDIKIYRARKNAMRVIEYLQEGKIQQAINEYLKANNYPEKALDDYLYGMLIMACEMSDNEKQHTLGTGRINALKKRFSPDKIKLQPTPKAGSEVNNVAYKNDDNFNYGVVINPYAETPTVYFKGSWRQCQNWKVSQPDSDRYHIIYLDDSQPNPEVSTFYFSSHPAPAVKDATLNLRTPKYGVCDSIDLYSMITKPKPLFVGSLDECLEWKAKNGMEYTMVQLTDEEVQAFLSQPTPEAGSETPPPNPDKPRN